MTEQPAPADPPAPARPSRGVDILALGMALSLFLVISVLLCVLSAFVLPTSATHLLARVFPVFDWRQPPPIAFAIELSLLWGWWAALVAGSVYNRVRVRSRAKA